MAFDPTAASPNQVGRNDARMSSASLLMLSNAIFFVFSALAVAASVAVFFLARATENQKNRDLEAYKAQAAAEISRAHVEIEQARAHAASIFAKAAAANRKTAALELQVQDERVAADEKPEAAHKHVGRPHKGLAPRTIARPVNIPLPVGMVDTRISIVSEAGHSEPKKLASAIRGLFDGGAPVSVDQRIGSDPGGPVGSRGVHIFRSHDAEAQRVAKMLFDVLSKNRIKCDFTDAGGDDEPHAASSQPQTASVVTVYVGRNPDE